MPAEASPAVATARGDACLAAADRLVVRKGLALNNPVTARLADGAADRAAAAAMALGCPETAFEGLVAFAAADLLRARQAAAKSDAATFGDAVAHARRGRDRLAALAGAGAWPGPPPAAADLVILAGRARAARLGAAAAAYYDELKHTNERVYYAKVPDAAPADATLTLAKATPFVPETGPPAPLKTPADDDPLLDAFDASHWHELEDQLEACMRLMGLDPVSVPKVNAFLRVWGTTVAASLALVLLTYYAASRRLGIFSLLLSPATGP